MELLPADLRSRLPSLYSQKKETDPIAHIKLSIADSPWTLYVTEGSPLEDDFIFFGWVVGRYPGFGFFSLNELSNTRSPLGLTIERDSLFQPIRLSKAKTLF